MADKKTEQLNKNLQLRPPVVVILGHVDHGKTSLLDYIKNTKIVEKESGGITQHIGAYQVEVPLKEAPKSRESEASRGIPPRQLALPKPTAKRRPAARDDFAVDNRKITFIDTPGHEAFSAMRSRGAKVADIAILVVAADDGVKPQTKEAINHIKKAGLSTIVAINKIDKPGALPEKVKSQLAEQGINVESYGGNVPSVEVSAKTGQGIDDLLEIILLVAEMEELKTDAFCLASGVIIEAFQDASRGATATLLVKEGSLKTKDIILTESACGVVKRIEDWRGRQLEQAQASQPVAIIGLEKVPMVGEKWQVVDDLDIAREKASQKGLQEQRKRAQAEVLDIGPGQKVLNIILKADVLGSQEAIRECLDGIKTDEVVLRILKAEVGDINESDIKLANSAHSAIIGFRVKCSGHYNQLADQKEVNVFLFNVIYELIQKVRGSMANLLTPEIVRIDLAKLKVIALFKPAKNGQVFGAKVLSGKVEKGLWVDVIRREEKVGRGKILHLQHEKEEVENLSAGKNAGILFKADFEVELDDALEAYREEKRKRVL